MLNCARSGETFLPFLTDSTVINCANISTRIYIATFPQIVKGQAIVFCDEINSDAYTCPEIYLECCGGENIAPYIFTPAKWNISSGIKAISMLGEFAQMCISHDIECVYINGHFNQADSDKNGRGHILSSVYNIQTMDIFQAVKNPFYRLALGIKRRGE